jgi:hypothetical protein
VTIVKNIEQDEWYIGGEQEVGKPVNTIFVDENERSSSENINVHVCHYKEND